MENSIQNSRRDNVILENISPFAIRLVGSEDRPELRSFEVELVEDLRGYVVKLPRYSKYAPVLKISVAMIETPEWRIFLMKDLAAVEEAERQEAKPMEVEEMV